ncbi:secondary thiamine-phosphate synthase enzyme YjbQ [Sulfurimonas sp. HSL-3221]|uniref:secondary thiamine-phosphate synthase enzyme YjbQ n=1 Tax=Thiomicrolovo sulfuroxydans TaxID=2894755 RepID=UPI001E3941E9|nr:secondary thiamine-phosphate synthase enzyme YjbQ [Sulfurimonas sp. HSL-3221]UFS62441.1 secondary thiamine-phosphate synthase enzyme YjbQ [Sulfurimonas sp. HSL-3221]
MKTLTLTTKSKTEITDITDEIREAVITSGVKEGICVVFTPHTTTGVMLSENVDPRLQRDLLGSLARIAPDNVRYAHGGGNAAAHIKSARTGVSITIPVVGGRPLLGEWQGVLFAEFDGPREAREVMIKIIAG